MVSSQRPVQYSLKDKPIRSQTILLWFYETILIKKAKKFGGMKNELYCKRSYEIHTYWKLYNGIALPKTLKSNSSEMETHVLCSL